MPGDAFEQVIRVHLDSLHRTLVAEHRLAVEHLEGRIAAWEEETESLPGSCNLRTSQASSSCAARHTHLMLGDAVLNSADDRSPHDVRLPEVSPSSPLKESGHRHSTSSTRATSRRSLIKVSRRGSLILDKVPISRNSLRKDADESQCGDGAGTEFQVLWVWDNSRPNTINRRISRRQTVTSMDKLLSSESEGGDSTTDSRIESILRRLVVLPSSLQHSVWEILGLVFAAFDIIVVPLQIFVLPQLVFLLWLTWCVRCFWTFDILVSFLTGYVSPKGFVELRPAKVARQYFHTRFCFDVALVSCDWVEALLDALGGGQSGGDATALQLLRMLRAIRLMRLLRLIKSQKIYEFIFERIRSEGVKLVAYIFFVMLLLLCLIHVIACMWHGIRHGSGDAGRGNADDPLLVQYFSAFHYVLSLFAGEHLWEPEDLPERLFVIAVLVLALVVSAAFVGSLTTAMTQLQIIASKRSTQFAALNRYLSDYGISRELASRVEQNARHALTEQERHTPESRVELMALISDSLRSEIHYEVYSPVLTLHPFFCLYNKVNDVGMRQICASAVSPVSVSRGDVIFSEFEVPVSPRMFFVVSGRLVYVAGAEDQSSVTAKQWVAEAVLWTEWAHRGTLRAQTESRLLSVDAQRVANIMGTFPTGHGFSYAARFVESLNQAACSTELTDLSAGEEEVRHMAACVFQELDSTFEVPWKSRSRRSSNFSGGSLVRGPCVSPTSASGRSFEMCAVPDGTSA